MSSLLTRLISSSLIAMHRVNFYYQLILSLVALLTDTLACDILRYNFLILFPIQST